jgi:hypothetical protein
VKAAAVAPLTRMLPLTGLLVVKVTPEAVSSGSV